MSTRQQPDKGIEAVKARLDKTPDWAQGYQILGQVAQRAGRLSVRVGRLQQSLEHRSRS